MEAGFSLGSNLGDRKANIERALEALFLTPGISFCAASSFYETPPWGLARQPSFLNVCAAGDTTLDARALLARIKEIEQALGRRPAERWGPRLIDIDILYLGAREVVEDDLAIPHRELFNRGFVLLPLAEIRPGLSLSGRSVAAEAERHAAGSMPRVAPPWSPSSAHDD